ncbi:hypothetical protein KKH23_05980 [Patescibacteria group bacterium]|nr:hypothetical protein [Patescibacteria group bacterium]MBU0846721.1 hypothetical protein [Patescibacteria group bacterium]
MENRYDPDPSVHKAHGLPETIVSILVQPGDLEVGYLGQGFVVQVRFESLERVERFLKIAFFHLEEEKQKNPKIPAMVTEAFKEGGTIL